MSEIDINELCEHINGFGLCCKFGGSCESNSCELKSLIHENNQLKVENKQSKENYIRIDSLLYECEAEVNNLRSELEECMQCLNEIEEICKNTELYEWCEYAYSCKDKLTNILQKIKEVKENE